jgi:DNA polymerase-3 subunit delta'
MSEVRRLDMPWLRPAWDLFRERMEGERLAHAMLLHGPEGIGKSRLARLMLETLLCAEPGPEGPCGECRSCKLLVGGAHPDAFTVTFRVDPKTQKRKKEILVEQIRDLIGSLSLTTTFSRRKVALVYPADAMNRNAANALLKTLEEPPGETVILLVAHEASRLPVTVRSRCQALAVPMPNDADAIAWLRSAEGFGEGDARDALLSAAGAPVKAAQYHRDGLVDLHRGLSGALEALYGGEDRIADVLTLVRETDAEAVWLWLSGLCRKRLQSTGPRQTPSRALLHLQRQADINRRLSKTAVRGDLLLRDWLIEWCRAGATARLES